MNIHGWKFEKRKVNFSKRPSEKNGLEQKKKKLKKKKETK